MSYSTPDPSSPRTPLSIPTAYLTPHGLEMAPYQATSLADAVQYEPRGVYTVGRTFSRIYTLLFDEHLARLAESAGMEGIAMPRVDAARLRAALRTLIDHAGYEESRFRITVPRETPDQFVISLEPFTPMAPSIVQNGVSVVTLHLARRNPAAKNTDWMTERRAEALPEGVYEGILVDTAGNLLEGSSSNFYGILAGKMRTARHGVLRGIAQRVLMQVAPDILPVEWEPVSAEQIGALDEALLTSASRGVVPVVKINGTVIGDGQPGPRTSQLRKAYEAWADSHLEAL